MKRPGSPRAGTRGAPAASGCSGSMRHRSTQSDKVRIELPRPSSRCHPEGDSGHPLACSLSPTESNFHTLSEEKRHSDTGGIFLTVHGGGNTPEQFSRYRRIRVEEQGK